MLNNYRYFLALTEELNISRAADKLFISHQCLSKYLKNIEEEYHTKFFTRKPRLGLTYAGQLMLDSLRKVEIIESNLNNQLEELQNGQVGELRIGTTEGRLRLLMPDLLHEFKQLYPNVELRMVSARTQELTEMLEANKLDLAIIGTSDRPLSGLRYDIVLREHLYLVVSDNMLQQYFSETYPECKEAFAHGADLKLFQHIPFVLNYPKFPSRSMIDRHLLKVGTSLNCINESTAMDLHHLMSARDYAASFCLTMYLPGIWKMNTSSSVVSPLNIFPIADFHETHPIAITYSRDKIFPEYARVAMKIIQKLCEYYRNIDRV